MDEDNSSMTATRKFGIRAPDPASSPVPAVEPSVFSVPSHTESPSATANAVGLTDASKFEQLVSDRNQVLVSQQHYLAVIPMTAYHVSTPYERVQFSIFVTSFEKKTGVRLNKGKIYHIKGTIGNICAFEKRLFRSSHLVIVVPAKYGSLVSPGKKYDVGIVSVEERKRFAVHQQLKNPGVIVIRGSALQSIGISPPERGKEVVELMIRKASGEDELPKRVFANIQQSTGFIRFNAERLGGRPGEVYEVVSERKYSVRDFVKEFNSGKPNEARNVQLVMDQGNTLSIQLDGRLFRFAEYSLFRAASRLLLRTKLSFYKMELRFWFDGKRFAIRFGVHDVTGFRILNNGKIKFDDRMDDQAIAAQRELYSQGQSLRSPVLRQFERLLGKLKVISTPAGVAGSYVFEVDAELCRFVCSRLEKVTKNEYSTRKGGFGEMISSRILSGMYPEICEHPSVKFPKASGCHKQGVDYQMRRGDSEGVDLFEFKWWKNVRAAINEGRIQARKRLVEGGRYGSSGPIRAVFVAALDWDPESTTGSLIVVQA
jgi:hypothetical protein